MTVLEALKKRHHWFWTVKVEKRQGGFVCWPCRTSLFKGYGRLGITVDGKVIYLRAHRAAWMLANDSEVPLGVIVMHTCDYRACCNPYHLKLGSTLDNNEDARVKGRFSYS